MQVHNLEKKIIAKILAKLPPSPNKKILINVKMFFWIPKTSIFIPIYSNLLLNINTCVFANMVSQCKKYKIEKLKKNKYKINLLWVYFLHNFTFNHGLIIPLLFITGPYLYQPSCQRLEIY